MEPLRVRAAGGDTGAAAPPRLGGAPGASLCLAGAEEAEEEAEEGGPSLKPTKFTRELGSLPSYPTALLLSLCAPRGELVALLLLPPPSPPSPSNSTGEAGRERGEACARAAAAAPPCCCWGGGATSARPAASFVDST